MISRQPSAFFKRFLAIDSTLRESADRSLGRQRHSVCRVGLRPSRRRWLRRHLYLGHRPCRRFSEAMPSDLSHHYRSSSDSGFEGIWDDRFEFRLRHLALILGSQIHLSVRVSAGFYGQSSFVQTSALNWNFLCRRLHNVSRAVLRNCELQNDPPSVLCRRLHGRDRNQYSGCRPILSPSDRAR
jgi:hypothetical protein